MQHRDADAETDSTTAAPTEEGGGPALRDAGRVLARIQADEATAAAARSAYREAGLPALEPDAEIAPELRAGEQVHARRSPALLNRPTGSAGIPGYAGTLYVTSRRLVHIGQAVFSVALGDIEELGVIGERFLVTLRSGEGVSLDVSEPRLLRVQVNAARAALGSR